jgi:hypothetical protein
MIGQLAGALSDCDRMLTFPTSSDRVLNIRGMRGLVYLKMKNPDAAIADYSAELAAHPKSARALYGRGLAEQMKGDQAAFEADSTEAKSIQADIADKFAQWGAPTPTP